MMAAPHPLVKTKAYKQLAQHSEPYVSVGTTRQNSFLELRIFSHSAFPIRCIKRI